MSLLANRTNLREVQERKIDVIKEERRKKIKKFNEQQLKNHEDLLIKKYKKDQVQHYCLISLVPCKC